MSGRLASHQLRYLDISNNKIKKLPTGLGTMDRLQKIKVLGNPLNRVPKEIVDVRSWTSLFLLIAYRTPLC